MDENGDFFRARDWRLPQMLDEAFSNFFRSWTLSYGSYRNHKIRFRPHELPATHIINLCWVATHKQKAE